jgi:prepilin-type N-terminal cleavage/methylation domain-containing protein
MLSNSRGMTLVEIMIVVMVISILAAIGMASHFRARETSQRVLCTTNRAAIEHAERRLMLETGETSVTMQQLETDGYIKRIELCPAGGEYAWVEYPESSSLYHSTVACSVHGTGTDEEEEPAE